jgi:hypothetical protein
MQGTTPCRVWTRYITSDWTVWTMCNVVNYVQCNRNIAWITQSICIHNILWPVINHALHPKMHLDTPSKTNHTVTPVQRKLCQRRESLQVCYTVSSILVRCHVSLHATCNSILMYHALPWGSSLSFAFSLPVGPAEHQDSFEPIQEEGSLFFRNRFLNTLHCMEPIPTSSLNRFGHTVWLV